MALCALLLPACALFSPRFATPQLSIVGIEMQNGNLFQQNFRVTLHIHNPNDRALPVGGLTAHLAIGGEPIADGTTYRGFVVPARGEAEFDVIVAANLAGGIAVLSKHWDDRGAPVAYDLSGVVRLDRPWHRSLPFHQSGSFPLSN